jgi:hypothetical protein
LVPGGLDGKILRMGSPRPNTLRTALSRPMHWVWATLLVICGIFFFWWEHPVQEGTATLELALQVQGLPEGTRGALWTGPTKAWKGIWDPGQGWRASKGARLAFPPHQVPIALRRLRQGILLRRTHDLAVVLLEAPDGTRRYFVYDLREDLASGMLHISRPLNLQVSCRWTSLKGTVNLPPGKDRRPVGY